MTASGLALPPGGRRFPRVVYPTPEGPKQIICHRPPTALLCMSSIAHLDIASCIASAADLLTVATHSLVLGRLYDPKKSTISLDGIT